MLPPEMADQEFDEYLDAVVIGTRERREIAIVDYDPGWPDRFRREAARIHGALGAIALSVEHIGSTAVPGLAAKPIVDILVTVAQPDDEASYCPSLVRAGYVLRVREIGHRMFRTPEGDVHIHIWSAPSDVQRHLVFRDRLRSDQDARAAYEATKRELARNHRDVNHYARAKTAVIDRILGTDELAPQRSE